jgi:hypothetical protein
MSFWGDLDSEMHPVLLDMDTADRLLAGTVAPDDAPPGYAEVARLLEALSAEPTGQELAYEAEVVAEVASAVRSSSSTHSPRRSFMPLTLSRPRITAALVAAALACTIGLASASALPGAAQDIASAMLAEVGISVSGPNDNAGTHPNVRGTSTVTPSDAGKGSDISDLATTTELSGFDKGAAISSAASEGKSQAGTHGGGSGASAPVATPNSGGTGTADTASGGKSSTGTGTADTASGGHSSAGSGNAGAGQERADEASGGHSGGGQANRP